MQILHWLHIYKFQSIVLLNSPQKLRASPKFKAGHLWEYVFNRSGDLHFSIFVYNLIQTGRFHKSDEKSTDSDFDSKMLQANWEELYL